MELRRLTTGAEPLNASPKKVARTGSGVRDRAPKHSSVSWVQGASRTSVALRKLASPAMTLVWARISQKPTLRAFRFERSTLSKTKPNPRHPSVRRETLLQKAGLKSSSGSSARRAWRSTLRRFHEAKELAGCEEGCKSRHPIKGPARKRVEVTGLSRELTALAGVLCTWPPHPHFDHVRVRLHHWVYTHSEGTSCTHASLSVFFKSCRNVSEGPCWPHRNDRRSLTRRDSLCERAHKKNFTINQPQGKSCRPADKKRTRKAATNSGGQQETECVAGVDSRMLSSLCGRALQQDFFCILQKSGDGQRSVCGMLCAVARDTVRKPGVLDVSRQTRTRSVREEAF